MYYSIKERNGHKTLTIITNKIYSVDDTSENWNELMEAVKENNESKVIAICDKSQRIRDYVCLAGMNFEKCLDGTYAINTDDEQIQISGQTFNYLEKIVDMGLSITPYIKFAKNLNNNPSFQSKIELLDFLEVNELPITEDGCFIAYKGVETDYMDCHSRTFRNMVGDTVEMERDEVCADRNKYCASGLHFCSIKYINNEMFGRRLMLIKINPMDVVSIPDEYESGKGRCCKYIVVGEIEPEQRKAIDEEIREKPVMTDIEIKARKIKTYSEDDKQEFLNEVSNIFEGKKFNREEYRKHFSDTQYLKFYNTFTEFKKELQGEE